MVQFDNQSNLKFTDISTEEWREYIFPEGVVRINNPTHLHVSESGGHRIFVSETGMSHYIPSGWLHLRWYSGTKGPHFVL